MLIYKQRHSAEILDRYKTFAVILLSIGMGTMFGMISSKGDVLMISMVASLLIGMFLVLRPAWMIWIIFTLGILVIGLVPLYLRSLETKAGWGVSILGFVVLFMALYRVATDDRAKQYTPAFIWLSLVFFVYSIVVSIIGFYTIDQFATCFKRYFQMLGLMFALCWLPFEQKQFRSWLNFFMISALLQFPFALFELLVWVPIRKGMQNSSPGMVPMDVVAGTFGSTYDGGGNSGEMSAFQVIVVGFLLSRYMQNILAFPKMIWLVLAVLSPLMIAETKAVIVMLPLMILGLYYREFIARPHVGIMILLVGTLLTAILGMAYMEITNQTMDAMIDDTMKYNVGETGYGEYSLNRTTAITFWYDQQGWHDPMSLFFGNGLGAAHIAPKGAWGSSAMRFPGYGIGLTTVTILLWEMGFLGFLLYLSIYIAAWRTAAILYQQSHLAWVRADAAAIQAAIVVFFFHMFYTMGLVEVVVFQIVSMGMFGYLAWMYRQHKLSTLESL